MNFDFNEELNKRVDYVNEVLENYGVPDNAGLQKTVMDAMEYSLKAGGKRLRPIMMYETYKMFGGNDNEIIEPFMTAIELIHTYSLVHDDLPAMDNDEYRRGRKTTHVVFGEDMAILCGDALLNYAFEVALKATEKHICNGLNPLSAVKALRVLADNAGIYGMVGGQVFDVEAERKGIIPSFDDVLFVYENKTSALIKASLAAGAYLAGADEKDITLLNEIGSDVGMAFQIKDDILDITSTTEVLGKPVGSDEKNNKTTYVTLKGLDKSQEDVAKYSERALDNFNSLSEKNDFLYELIKYLIDREK